MKQNAKEIDHNRLPPGQHLVAPDKWPTIGERLPPQPDRPWNLAVTGQVESQESFSLEKLSELSQTELTCDIHCVTRWSKFDVTFRGVGLADLLSRCRPSANARYISFIARSERNHSSSLVLQEALDLDALIATELNGEPLPVEKGGPIRLIVPGRYFYKSVKWVETIELLEQDRLGFWESDSGYHNRANPWQEERFISQTVNKKEAKRLIDARDFSNQDLLSLVVSNHDLSGLNASGALLRNADFSGCDLTRADFSGANLSNANFVNANLTSALFNNADLEGADLSGADLAGTDLTGVSLFGATFFESRSATAEMRGARFDERTRISNKEYDVLTPEQLRYVEQQLEL